MNDSPPPVAPRLAAALAGRYAFERQLGRGGMATVYLARDLRYDRAVAVKVLRSELSTGDTAARFLREIGIAARLQHPHIAAVLDSGEIAPGPAGSGDAASPLLYYVMPYVEGETLRDRMQREGPLPIAEATRILSGVLGALAHAHAHGVLHRDIKPENVIVVGEHAYVLDFGIARIMHDTGGGGLTMTGVAIGTPAYMAPEQLLPGEAVDARTDVYAVGMLAYELLAGRAPFPRARLWRGVPRPTTVVQGLLRHRGLHLRPQ